MHLQWVHSHQAIYLTVIVIIIRAANFPCQGQGVNPALCEWQIVSMRNMEKFRDKLFGQTEVLRTIGAMSKKHNIDIVY